MLKDSEKLNIECPKNIYIIKPGEETNRGKGIKVLSNL